MTGRTILTSLWRFLSLYLLLLHLEARSTSGSFPNQRGKAKRRFLLPLLNVRETSKLWDRDILVKTLQDLKKPYHAQFQARGKDAQASYASAGNVARYLNLEEIEAIYLPVSVNFIFVGFDGSGNYGARLSELELHRWFEHIEHVQRHVRVPRGSFQAGRDEYAAEGVASVADDSFLPQDPVSGIHLDAVAAATLLGPVHYNYTVRAIEMEAGMTRFFERAIQTLSRKEDPEDKRGEDEILYQVDLDGMLHIMSSLLDYLMLNRAYNIFILNANNNATRQHYGYRRGLSFQELQALHSDERKRAALAHGQTSAHFHLHDKVVPIRWPDEVLRRPLFHPQDGPTLYNKATDHMTGEFATTFRRALDAFSADLTKKKMPDFADVDLAFLKAQEILAAKGGDPVLKKRLKDAMGTGQEREAWEPECLVNSFVSNGRFAFLDLSATPCTWGPQVGGEGVMSNNSLPAVAKGFGEEAQQIDKTDEDLEKELEKMAEERFDFFDEDNAEEVDMISAEMDVYEQFAKKHCADRRKNIKLCQELVRRMETMKKELDEYEKESDGAGKSAAAAAALERLKAMDLFPDAEDDAPGRGSLSHNLFFAELAAVLSRGMRHVFTPASLVGTFHFWPNVNFQLYIISTKGRAVADVNKHAGFDVEALKEHIRALAMENQHFSFATHMLAIGDDAALGMAYATSLRYGTVPTLDVSGITRASRRTYLDSRELEHQLSLLPDASLHHRRRQKGSEAVLEVPVFVFVSRDEPVFIDKHHVAAALKSMVLVAASGESSFRSYLQCNGRAIKWDLRDPTRYVVEAVAKHLAGILPMHVSYSPSNQAASQDWLWSVGAHALSATSASVEISTLQHDALARSYIVTALDESVQRINAAIALLQKEIPHESTYKVFRQLPVKALLDMHNIFLEDVQQLAKKVEHVVFGSALASLSLMERHSISFLAIAEHMVSELHPAQCVRRRTLNTGLAQTATIVGVCFFFLIVFVLRRRQSKPKIN